MNYFKEYIISVITIGVFAFIAEITTTHFSKDGNLTKGIKFISSICVFTVAAMPFLTVFTGLKNTEFDIPAKSITERSESDFTFTKLTQSQTEKALQQQIYNGTGIMCYDISIEISYEDNEIKIESIDITVEDEAKLTPVKEYTETLFGKTQERITVKTK